MSEPAVVILDDEVQILDLCRRLFKTEPYLIHATTDHLEAMRIIEEHPVKLVLSDNRMPGIRGVDFLKQVKEKKPAIIRILFTGNADLQTAEDAINKGEVYRLINKPLDLKDLLLLVRESLERYDLVGKNQELTERLSKRNEELEILSLKALQGVEAQKQFTSTVSHELRTPLASIKSSIDILNTEAPGPLTEDQKTFIKRVKTNIDRLSRLINDVLDLSKLESGKMVMHLASVRPEDSVREAQEMFASAAQSKGLELNIELAANLPDILADKDRLAQVFSNLVSNALKFTQSGSITISVMPEEERNVVFCVQDTGGGIKKDDVPRLFEKFQQVGGVHQQVSGTGLGLAICKEIIGAHGGRVWVESEFEKGSQFYFSVPAKLCQRVLIVDDDPVTVALIKSILFASGKYEVASASDGFLAGQKCNSFKPHVMILDVNMPEMNGWEVCARLKDNPDTRDIRIIMHSIFLMRRKKQRLGRWALRPYCVNL